MHKNYNSYNLELKSATDAGFFSGYASVFNVKDAYEDIILPGAFAKSLAKNRDIKLLWQHDPRLPIGKFSKVEENVNGLYVEGQIILDLAQGNEAYLLLKSGSIKGLSIGYTVNKTFHHAGARYIKEATLWEISVVTFPANTAAVVRDVKDDSSMLQGFSHALETAKRVLRG